MFLFFSNYWRKRPDCLKSIHHFAHRHLITSFSVLYSCIFGGICFTTRRWPLSLWWGLILCLHSTQWYHIHDQKGNCGSLYFFFFFCLNFHFNFMTCLFLGLHIGRVLVHPMRVHSHCFSGHCCQTLTFRWVSQHQYFSRVNVYFRFYID